MEIPFVALRVTICHLKGDNLILTPGSAPEGYDNLNLCLSPFGDNSELGLSSKSVLWQVGVMAAVGKAFGLSVLQAVRAGLLLAAGGEFAFVTFGEAVSHKILPAALVSKLFLIVALSMALTPLLAEFGQRLGKMFEKSDVKVTVPACFDPFKRQRVFERKHVKVTKAVCLWLHWTECI